MTPFTENIKFVQGETQLLRVSFTIGSTPADLTGYTFSSQFHGALNNLSGVFAFDTSTLALGYITLVLDRFSSAAIVAGVYRYDIFAVSPANVATVIVRGSIEVVPRVTTL